MSSQDQGSSGQFNEICPPLYSSALQMAHCRWLLIHHLGMQATRFVLILYITLDLQPLETLVSLCFFLLIFNVYHNNQTIMFLSQRKFRHFSLA